MAVESKAGKTPGFEEALGRLETIVEEMEGGTLDLETMIKRFEEGQGLLKFCSKTLDQMEKKVEVLVKKDGDVTAEPFGAPDVEMPTAGGGSDELF